MKYRVTYLAARTRASIRITAPNAASAVARARQEVDGPSGTFELLSVMPLSSADATSSGEIPGAFTPRTAA